jgi:hypothetical protein
MTDKVMLQYLAVTVQQQNSVIASPDEHPFWSACQSEVSGANTISVFLHLPVERPYQLPFGIEF